MLGITKNEEGKRYRYINLIHRTHFKLFDQIWTLTYWNMECDIEVCTDKLCERNLLKR